MAGGQSEDDAVSLNVTPLIDIIFCLCIFFKDSYHFKQHQGKHDSRLPNDKGNQAGGASTANMDEIRIIISKDSGTGQTRMAFGSNVVGMLPLGTNETPERKAVLDNLE